MTNRLGIPSEGINFCTHCFEFHFHKVDVDENGDCVTVSLVCTECDQIQIVSDAKNTFYEYDNAN